MTTAGRLATAVCAYAGLAALWGGRAGPVLCPYRRLTGERCPLCGLTRAVGRTARGDLEGGVAHHPAGPAVLAFALTVTVRRALAEDGQPEGVKRRTRRFCPGVSTALRS